MKVILILNTLGLAGKTKYQENGRPLSLLSDAAIQVLLKNLISF